MRQVARRHPAEGEDLPVEFRGSDATVTARVPEMPAVADDPDHVDRLRLKVGAEGPYDEFASAVHHHREVRALRLHATEDNLEGILVRDVIEFREIQVAARM